MDLNIGTVLIYCTVLFYLVMRFKQFVISIYRFTRMNVRRDQAFEFVKNLINIF